MKTSELRKLLKESGEAFKENEICFESEHSYWYVFKEEKSMALHGGTTETAAELLTAYYFTPIEEREEEKKYYIEMFEGMERHKSAMYLALDNSDGLFFFANNYENVAWFYGTFRQTEIDRFPIEIQKAIECGFLKKVEAKT